MSDAAPIHDVTELTLFIEERYHRRHRAQLPTLAEKAHRVEMVHSANEDVPAGLSVILHRMFEDLDAHMKKEEMILFPAMCAGGGPGISAPIAVMRADHDSHDREIEEIRRLTRNLSLPDKACGTWGALYSGLAEFIDDLTEHTRLENDVLFPQFEGR